MRKEKRRQACKTPFSLFFLSSFFAFSTHNDLHKNNTPKSIVLRNLNKIEASVTFDLQSMSTRFETKFEPLSQETQIHINVQKKCIIRNFKNSKTFELSKYKKRPNLGQKIS